MNKTPPVAQVQILMVKFCVKWLNLWLEVVRRVLFFQRPENPQNILIFKIGNIGDIVCAVPALMAIRCNFPRARITLLTSPGSRRAPGARELLRGARYLDEIRIYYSDEIDSWSKRKAFINGLRTNNYDLFVQIPDDLVTFRMLFRNLVFAKLIGARSAFGFKIRTIQLFKKAQVDYTRQKTEIESLMELLKDNGLEVSSVVQEIERLATDERRGAYGFDISAAQKSRVKDLLKEKWGKAARDEIVVAISAGCKRETNRWPAENFKEVARQLQRKYKAKIIVIGGPSDVSRAEFIKEGLYEDNLLITAGKLEILETFELLKYCSFLISNSTGAIHLAAAAGTPAVGLYTVRDVFGRWFPYGKQHKILYHRFIDCDYKSEKCIRRSIEMIGVEEVVTACEALIRNNPKSFNPLIP